VWCSEARRREVRRQTAAMHSNAVDRRGAEYRGTQNYVELVHLKCESDDVEDASTPADVAAMALADNDVETDHVDDHEVLAPPRRNDGV